MLVHDLPVGAGGNSALTDCSYVNNREGNNREYFLLSKALSSPCMLNPFTFIRGSSGLGLQMASHNTWPENKKGFTCYDNLIDFNNKTKQDTINILQL